MSSKHSNADALVDALTERAFVFIDELGHDDKQHCSCPKTESPDAPGVVPQMFVVCRWDNITDPWGDLRDHLNNGNIIVDLRFCECFEDTTDMGDLPVLPHVESLSTPPNLTTLAHLPAKCPNLTHLDISATKAVGPSFLQDLYRFDRLCQVAIHARHFLMRDLIFAINHRVNGVVVSNCEVIFRCQYKAHPINLNKIAVYLVVLMVLFKLHMRLVRMTVEYAIANKK